MREVAPRRAIVVTTPVTLDPAHEYSLVELIDLAQRANPVTREAWEEARAAAARLGIAETVYLPALALAVTGGARREAYPTPEGPFTATGPYLEPRAQLTWALLDLSRFAAVDVARALAEQASFAFSRQHQEVMFGVARAFYALDASHARLEAAQATLKSATVDEEAVQARLQVGLATRPELLLARETRARAAFDVEAAVGAVRANEGALAEVVGAMPLLQLRITPLALLELPQRIEAPVQQILETALRERPDLQALSASLEGREADVRRAWRSFAPRLSLTSMVGGLLFRFEASPPDQKFLANTYVYDTRLRLDWELFTGFSRLNDVKAAQAQRAASAATLSAGELRAVREAWTAYFDVQVAQRKVEYATALLASADEAYAATLETYRRGLSTVIDLVTAERDLANARSIIVESRAELLTAAASLALAVGAIPETAR
jgi:outer membrane protein TolC